MIITLTGATFTKYIGTLDSYTVFTTVGTGCSPASSTTTVDKDSAYSETFTLSDNYAVGSAGITITMGTTTYTEADTSVISVSGQTITISIPSITATTYINSPTVNTSTGDEDSGTVVNPDTGEYPFDTASMIKFDLSAAEWEQGTVGNTGANGSSATRIRTKTPYSVPYDNVTFYVKVDSPYVGGIRSGTSATSTPLNQYWFSNDAEYGGGISSKIPSPNIGWEITIPTGHTMFWPVLAVGDGTQTNNTTNILPADASSTGFEL